MQIRYGRLYRRLNSRTHSHRTQVINMNEKDCDFQTSFTDHSHTGCVRCVAISNNGFLASGSSDESIRLFNLKKRKEVGSLVHHNGYISSLAFFGKSHLFSCSADGTIGIWRVGKWECEKILRGHKDAVLGISVHPSGKLALSISQNKMRTWNLQTGKCAYITNIKNGDLVRWTPDGEMYIVVSRDVVHIYSTKTADVISSPAFGFRINCVHFIKSHILVVGGEGGNVHFYDLKKKAKVHQLDTKTIRVKDLSMCEVEGKTKLVTGSSDGYIQVWHVMQEKENWKTTLDGSMDTKFRIVSLAVRSLSAGTAPSKSKGSVLNGDTPVDDESEGEMESVEEDSENESKQNSTDDSEEDFEGDSEDGESDAERCSKLQRVDVNPRKHQKTDHHTKQNKKTGGKKQSKEWQNENKGTIKTARSKDNKHKLNRLQKKKQLKKLKLKGNKLISRKK